MGDIPRAILQGNGRGVNENQHFLAFFFFFTYKVKIKTMLVPIQMGGMKSWVSLNTGFLWVLTQLLVPCGIITCDFWQHWEKKKPTQKYRVKFRPLSVQAKLMDLHYSNEECKGLEVAQLLGLWRFQTVGYNLCIPQIYFYHHSHDSMICHAASLPLQMKHFSWWSACCTRPIACFGVASHFFQKMWEHLLPSLLC